jgi:predicted DNA-binding protein with PD1-like motif
VSVLESLVRSVRGGSLEGGKTLEEARIQQVHGYPGRLIVSRILPGSDLVSGLIEICKTAEIRTGLVTVCVGSLRRAQFQWSVPSDETRRGSERSRPIILEGPIEFLSGQGIIGRTEGDEFVTHLHGTLCDKNGRVFGGHFFVGGNYVHSTMDVVMIEAKDVAYSAQHDPEIELTVLMAKERISEL